MALFPLGAGPFTATHGPLTALRALAFAILLFVAISFLQRVLVACPDLYLKLRIQVVGVAVCQFGTRSESALLILRPPSFFAILFSDHHNFGGAYARTFISHICRHCSSFRHATRRLRQEN